MIRYLWPVVVLSLAESAFAQSQIANDTQSGAEDAIATARATATIIGPNPSYVGQMVEIEVELLRDDRQADKGAPFFPEIEVNDAIALLSTSAPPPETKKMDGVLFLGQKRRYLVFPQVSGTLSIPAITISLPTEHSSATVVTPPLHLTATLPRGTTRRPLIAQRVMLERLIDRDLNTLRVGDAFTITLRLSAEQTDPVMLPSIKLPEMSGMSLYPGEASTRAHADRGTYKAERIERATYVASEWGFRDLPAQSVLWLDPTTGNYAEATAPALSFRVRMNPQLGLGCIGGRAALARTGSSLALLLLLVVAALSSWRRWSSKRAQRALVPRSDEEKSAFYAFKAAANSGQDGPTITALYRWLTFAVPGATTIGELRDRSSSAAISKTTGELEQRVATGHGPGNSTELIAPLLHFRKAHKDITQAIVLPKLND